MRLLSGGGLTFNGDTAATNALSDYEEGTWVPADGSGAGLTLTQEATQRYVKIGSLVFVNMYVGYPSTTNSSTAIISGFPYAASSFNFLSGRVFNSGTNDMVWQVNGSSATLYFNNGLRTNANLTGAYVLLSGSYYTTS